MSKVNHNADFINELESTGQFDSTNKQLIEELYMELKPKYPELYKWKDNNAYKLVIIRYKDQLDELFNKRNEIQKEIDEIDSVINYYCV